MTPRVDLIDGERICGLALSAGLGVSMQPVVDEPWFDNYEQRLTGQRHGSGPLPAGDALVAEARCTELISGGCPTGIHGAWSVRWHGEGASPRIESDGLIAEAAWTLSRSQSWCW